jgi:WD40 repeat protein/serine/threonine protein kinase
MSTVWVPGQEMHGLYKVLEVTWGGMGRVYRVWHREWRIELAVKVPQPDRVASAAAMRNFEAEAEAWVGLGLHPNTVNCFYVRRFDDVPHVFAEWVDGGNLAEAVRARRIYQGGVSGPLDIAIQCAWGLAHAHANGLVHQDVKPANVLLSADGTAKVTDFGLAWARGAAGYRGAATGAGCYGGLTSQYCSPEQARAARGASTGLTHATDVWSWGLTMLEMFAGGMPTEDGSRAAAALDDILRAGPADPAIPAVPSALAQLLLRCFAADPAGRPDGMAELADRLVELYGELTGAPYPRQRPSAARLLADGLSNQALSMLDLGHPEQAEHLWALALRADPHHPHTVYNRGLHRWRVGRHNDADVVAALAEVRASHPDHWIEEYLLGLVHTERGDRDSAVPLLTEAVEHAPDVAPALEVARLLPTAPPPLQLDGHICSVNAVAVSANGRIAATGTGEAQSPTPPGSEGGVVRLWCLDTGRLLHWLPAYQHSVRGLALSDDGRVAASCGRGPEVLVWDVPTGHRRHRLPGEAAAVAMSPDGRRLASAAEDGSVRVWDLDSERAVRLLQRPCWEGIYYYDLAIAVGTDRVVRWEGGLTRLRVWDLTTGYLMRSVRLPRRRVILAPGARFALAIGERRLELWDTDRGELVRAVETDGDPGRAAAVSGDGRATFLSGPVGVQVWDLHEGRCVRTLARPHDLVAVDAAGQYAITAAGRNACGWCVPPAGPRAPWSYAQPTSAAEHARRAALVRGAADRAEAQLRAGRPRAAAEAVRVVLRTPGHERDRAVLALWARVGRHGRRTGLLAAWQAWEFPVQQVPDGGGPTVGTERQFSIGPAGAYSLSRDGHFFLGDAAVWDLHTGHVVVRLVTNGPELRGMALSPDGSLAVAGCQDRTVRMWEVPSGRSRPPLTGHPGEVDAVAFSVDGRLLITGCRERVVRVWDVASGACLRVLTGHEDWLVELAITEDNRFALAVGFDAVASAWDLAGGRYLRRPAGNPKHVTATMASADSRTYLAPGSSLGFHVTDLTTGRRRLVLREHDPRTVERLAVSADGRIAHSAGRDGAVRVWDLAQECLLHALTGHTGAVRVLAPCVEDRFTLSGGGDGTVRLWDLAAGTCLRTLAEHRGRVAWVGVSDDTRTVVSVGTDRTARVWHLAWDFEFPDPADWNDRAQPYLDAFRARRRWPGGEPADRELLDRLANAGLGWLRPASIVGEETNHGGPLFGVGMPPIDLDLDDSRRQSGGIG